MARAGPASASVRSDSIRGLAQSIAKPAYRRLLTAEPALRRAVPALIIAFLLTICVGASVQVIEHRRQTISEILKQIEAGSDLLAERIDATRNASKSFDRDPVNELDRLGPPWLRVPGRLILLTNPEGMIIAGLQYIELTGGERHSVAARPIDTATRGLRLIDLFRASESLTTLTTLAGPLEITMSDGDPALASLQHLKSGLIAVIHPRGSALAAWRSGTALTITLSATTGFVVLIL